MLVQGAAACWQLDAPTTTTHPPTLPQARFKYVDDLASVWCEWAEMELRHKNFRRALDLMRRATARPQRPRTREVRDGDGVGIGRWRGGPQRLQVLACWPVDQRAGGWRFAPSQLRPRPPPCLPAPPCLQEEVGLPVQDRLYRCLKLWSFYVDLEERCVACVCFGVGEVRGGGDAYNVLLRWVGGWGRR